MKSKKKTKKPKPRIKVAPSSKRHKSKKDYNRKKVNTEVETEDRLLEEEKKKNRFLSLGDMVALEERNIHGGSKFVDFMEEINQPEPTLEQRIVTAELLNSTAHLWDKEFSGSNLTKVATCNVNGKDIPEEELNQPKSWLDNLMSIFGFKRVKQ